MRITEEDAGSSPVQTTMSRKNNKYRNFPARKQVPVGGLCLLVECCRQVRKAAQPFVQGLRRWYPGRSGGRMGSPALTPKIKPGMIFSGINNLTGEKETFRITSIPISVTNSFSEQIAVKRIS